jgi:phosphatidylglycerophosphatase A
MQRVAVFVCSFGYVGFFPIAPGTVGSAAGLLVYLIFRSSGVPHFELPVIVALFGLGLSFGAACEKALGQVDPAPVVIDEVMGMLITLFLVPVNWMGMLAGFLVFRVLDIVKPYPARRLERLPGGLGIMADDAMAAFYANLMLHAAYILAPTFVS